MDTVINEALEKEAKEIRRRLKKWRKYIGIFRGWRAPYIYYIILRELAEHQIRDINDVVDSWLNRIGEYRRLPNNLKDILRKKYSNIFFHRMWELIRKEYVRGRYSITLKGLVALGLVDNDLPIDVSTYINLHRVKEMLRDGTIENLDVISDDELERLMWR